MHVRKFLSGAALLLTACASLAASATLVAVGAVAERPAPMGSTEAIRFGDPVRGQSLFVGKGCVKCHAVRGTGGRIGPDLGRKSQRSSYYAIASVMWNHSRSMEGKMSEYKIDRPAFDEGELTDLITFLYFLQYFDEPGDPRTGQVLFTKKQCVRCHSVAGQGGTLGGALDAIPRDTSPLRIAQSLWNHGPEMISALEEGGLAVPHFEGSELIDLFAFIRSHGERREARRFESPGDPTAGARVFQEKSCNLCHPIFGDEPGTGPDLGRAELRGSATWLAGRMWNHWPQMAHQMQAVGMSVPNFVGDELLDLFAYLYIVRYQGEPGDAERGRSLYEGAGCAVCHGLDGGGGAGADLRAFTEGRSEQEILQGMWNHAPEMAALLRAQNLSWPRLGPGELADLLAFLGNGWESSPPPDQDR